MDNINSHQRQDNLDERRPFLSPNAASTDGFKPSQPAPHRTRCTWSWLRVVILIIVIAIVSDIGESLWAAPRVRLFEASICARYYHHHKPSLVPSTGDIPEDLCKIDPVQDQLASILAWQLFFDSIPAILFPISFGNLADRHGRKWIIILVFLGYTLSYMWTLFVVGLPRRLGHDKKLTDSFGE